MHIITLQASEEGFSISEPSLPGCWSQGGTEAEALKSLREAIIDYLAVIDGPARTPHLRHLQDAAPRSGWMSPPQRRSLLRSIDASIARAQRRGPRG